MKGSGARRPKVGAVVVCALTLLACWFGTPSALMADEPLAVRLRIQWQDDAKGNVTGRIALSEGRIKLIRNLSFDGLTTGGFWTEPSGREVQVRPRATVSDGGMLLHAVTTSTAELDIQFETTNPAALASPVALTPLKVRVADIESQPKSFSLGSKQRIWISRLEGDGLRVEYDAPTTIVQAGSSLPLTIHHNGLSLAGSTAYECRIELHRAREQGVIASHSLEFTTDDQGRFAPLSHTVRLPDEDIACDLKISIVQRPRFQRERILELHTTQFVALRTEREPTAPAEFREIAVVPLTAPGSSDEDWIRTRLPEWLPHVMQSEAVGPWSSAGVTYEKVDDAAIARFAPRSWYAMRLPGLEVGKPHLVVIRVPNQGSLKIQATIIEADATGQVPALQTDTALVMQAPLLPTPNSLIEHRVVFWPRTSQPVLLLQNLHEQETTTLNSVTVLGGVEHLPGNKTTEPPSRLAALYLEKPTIVDAFGGSLAQDPVHGAVLPDWQSFLESGTRLVEYLRWAGYGGSVVSVSSEGGTLYPTECMASTGRYDSGVYFSSGQDPVQKDVLELLLRLCDREGLQLIPSVEFSTPLIDLERQLATNRGEESMGIEPMNAAGERLLENAPPVRGQAVYYNSLDPRVQESIKRCIEELGQRYGGHPALQGIAMTLGPRRFVQLPESYWNVDPVTMKRFVAQLPGQLPGDMQPMDWVTGVGRPQFLSWRGRQLASFIGALGKEVQPRPLYLLGADFSAAANPSAQASDVAQPELEYGWDWEALGGQVNVVPLRFHRSRPLGNFVQRVLDSNLDRDAGGDRRLAALAVSGVVLETPPEKTPWPEGLADPAWKEKGVPQFLLPHAIDAGDEARLRLARSLAQGDRWPLVVGGWSPPRGAESITADWLRVYSQLPAARFENVPQAGEQKTNYIQVRRLRTTDAFYLYAVNQAPWAVDFSVTFRNASGVTPIPLHAVSSETPLSPDKVRCMLGAGELIAFRLEEPEAEVLYWKAAPVGGEIVQKQIAEKLKRLSAAVGDTQAAEPPMFLPNGDFEAQGDGIPNWQISQHPSTSVTLDTKSPAQGQRSLRMESRDDESAARAWALSSPLAIPNTGRLALTARVRVESGVNRPMVRMAIEAKARGQTWRRATLVSAVATAASPESPWPHTPERLEIVDLPALGIEELRVAFDLVGPGVAWIDDIEVSTLYLTSAERNALQEDIYMAVQHLKSDDLTSACNLFRSPWTRELLALASRPATPSLPPTKSEQKPVVPTEPRTTERILPWLPRILR